MCHSVKENKVIIKELKTEVGYKSNFTMTGVLERWSIQAVVESKLKLL